MIISFAYDDLDSGWTLEEVRFDALNLLVGPSAAGKTRILEALLNVRNAALGSARGVPSARWKLVLEGIDRDREDLATEFTWEAETRVTRAEMPPRGKTYGVETWRAERTDAHFVRERIRTRNGPLLERSGTAFQFEDTQLPRLTKSESAIGLLGDNEALRPLHEALRLWRPLESEQSFGALDTVDGAESSRRRFRGELDLLRRDVSLPTFGKLYILQKDHRELFDHIEEDFVDIFPSVQELRVATYAKLGFRPHLGEEYMANSLALGMREEGVEGWVLHTRFSSGMAKTLSFLIETSLAPRGMVLLVDELENSLGVNCLPDVAGQMLKGLDRVQYIATSHHPRVINEIPFRRWKLVTRKGSRVRVLPAADIDVLRSASPLEKFTELINLPEYAKGVA